MAGLVPHPSPRRRRQAGFTLVELLVAMTLLAFLSLSLFGGLRFGARSWDAVASTSAERDRVALVQTFLRDRLSQTSAPGRGDTALAGGEGPLAGTSAEMEFTAPWLSALSLGGLYRFTVWHDDEGAGRLMLRWRPVGVAEEELDDLGDLAGERVLLEGVDGIAIAYFGAADPRDPPDWQDAWEVADRPPFMVRIDLALADPDALWPGFAVALNY